MRQLSSAVDFVINNWKFLSIIIPVFATGIGILMYGFWCMYRDSQEYRL